MFAFCVKPCWPLLLDSTWPRGRALCGFHGSWRAELWGRKRTHLIRHPEGKDRYQATQKGTGGLVRNHTTRLCDLLPPRPSIDLELFLGDSLPISSPFCHRSTTSQFLSGTQAVFLDSRGQANPWELLISSQPQIGLPELESWLPC